MTRSLTLPLHGLRSSLLNWSFQKSYPIYAKLWKRPKKTWNLNRQELSAYPTGSLGYAVSSFLKESGLDFIPGFESHDVFHTLLGYGTTAPEEVFLQCCLVGNGKRTPYAIMAVLVGLLLFPEHWHLCRKAYRKGKKMRRFFHWKFEYLLHENMTSMRSFLQKEEQMFFPSKILF